MSVKKIGNELSIRNHIMIRAWNKINPHINLKWNSTKAIDLLGVINYKCWKSRRDRTQTELGYTTKLLPTRKILIFNSLINKAANNLPVKYLASC